MKSKFKNTNVTKENHTFLQELKEKDLINQFQDIFRLGVAIALAIDPNLKISNDLVPNKENGSENLADAAALDEDGKLTFLINEISDESYEIPYERMQQLGNWGIKKIKNDFWDNSVILWEKIQKEAKI